MSTTLRLAVLASLIALCACAGPHGERPHLDNAVERPNSNQYGFTGGFVGATAGTGLKNDPGAGPDPHF